MFTHPLKCVQLQHFCPLWEPTEPSYGPILPQEWIWCHSKSDGSPYLLAPLKFKVKCKKKPTVNGFTNSHSKYSKYIQQFWLIFWLNKWLLRWYLKFKTNWKYFVNWHLWQWFVMLKIDQQGTIPIYTTLFYCPYIPPVGKVLQTHRATEGNTE